MQQESPYKDSPIPLVTVDHQGKYVMTKQSISFLNSVPSPLAVVSVAGLYRTGKSYLLNKMLLQKSNGKGFGVGPTVNPCTKGLWIWGKPLRGKSDEGQDINILVIDTEGIGALDEDQTHDTKIFTLAILASSCFIYNSQGSIDENALQNLSLVVNLTKNIQLKSNGEDENGIDPDEVSNYFPSFYWVVRDFTLQLQDNQGTAISSKEYLEKALAPQNGFSEDTEEKNRIRRLLTSFFKQRDCFTMVRPLVDEEKLQSLDSVSDSQLRPEFTHQVMDFRKRTLNSIKTKSLNGQKLDGVMYCSLIGEYVKSINLGAVPNIENAWNYMCQEQCRKVASESFELFKRQFDLRMISDNPTSVDNFNRYVEQSEEIALEFYREKAFGSKLTENLKDLKLSIKNIVSEARIQNRRLSQDKLKKYFKQTASGIIQKLNLNSYSDFAIFSKQVKDNLEKCHKDGLKLDNYEIVYLNGAYKLVETGSSYFFKSITKEKVNLELQMKTKTQNLKQQIEMLRSQGQDSKQKSRDNHEEMLSQINQLKNQIEKMSNSHQFKIKDMQELHSKKTQFLQEQLEKIQKVKDLAESKVRQLDSSQELKVLENLKRQGEMEKQIAVQRQDVELLKKELEELRKKEKKNQLKTENLKKEIQHEKELEFNKLESNYETLKNQSITLKKKIDEQRAEIKLKMQQIDENKSNLTDSEIKHKEEMLKIQRESSKMKRQTQQEIDNLKGIIESYEQNSTETVSKYTQKIQQTEVREKRQKQEFNKRLQQMKIELQLLEQKCTHEKSAHNNTKENLNIQRKQLEDEKNKMLQLEERIRDETENERVSFIKKQVEQQLENQRKMFENDINNFKNQIASLMKSKEENEKRLSILKDENKEKSIQLQTIRQQRVSDEENFTRKYQDTDESSKAHIKRIEKQYQRKIQQLQDEIDRSRIAYDERHRNEVASNEQQMLKIRNATEQQKQAAIKIVNSQKDKAIKRLEKQLEEKEEYYKNQTQELNDMIEQLKSQMELSSETLNNENRDLNHKNQHQRKQITNLKADNQQKKQELQRKQTQFNQKMELNNSEFKNIREKLDLKLDTKMTECNEKEKNIYKLSHQIQKVSHNLQIVEEQSKNYKKQLQNIKTKHTVEITTIKSRMEIEKTQIHNQKIQSQKKLALSEKEKEFAEKKIVELEDNLKKNQENFLSEIKYLKENKIPEYIKKIQNLKQNKRDIEDQLLEEKNKYKEIQNSFKRLDADSSRQKSLYQEKVNHLEEELRNQENSKQTQKRQLLEENKKFKEAHELLRKKAEAQKYKMNEELEKISNHLKEDIAMKQRQNILSKNNIKFLESQLQEVKEEKDRKTYELERKLQQAHANRILDKDSTDKKLSQDIYTIEEKYRNKNEKAEKQIRKIELELNSLKKQKENEISKYMQKSKFDKDTIENLQRNLDKKTFQFDEVMKKYDVDMKNWREDKEKMENDFRNKEEKERRKILVRLDDAENRARSSENEKNKQFFDIQLDRSRFQSQKDNLLEQISELKDKAHRFEKEINKIKTENQTYKLERKAKNTDRSFLSKLSTTPMKSSKNEKQKVEAPNKENQNINEF